MDALEEAESAYREGGLADLPLADVNRARATVLFSRKRFAEALRWLRAACETYRSYCDDAGLAQSKMLEAGILYEQGNVSEARKLFTMLVPLLESLADEESLARAFAGLCACAIRLDDIHGARRYAESAVEKYRKLDMSTEMIRLRWNLSQALLSHGETEGGLAELRRAAAEFTACGMLGGASEVGLNIVEELLARGEVEEACSLAKHLVEIFTVAGSDVDAAAAYEQLREAVQAGTMTPAFVRAIRVQLGVAEDRARGRQPSPA
jgi:tetratricopeptide (TPR) repeat protein